MGRTSMAVAGITMLAAILGAGCTDRPDVAREPTVRHTAPPKEMLSAADLQPYWQRELPLGPGEAVEGMWLVDENLYFLSNRQNLYAMNASTGVLRWPQAVSLARSRRLFSPIHVDSMRITREVGTIAEVLDRPSPYDMTAFDAVVINSLTRAYVIHRETGQMYRDFTFHKFSATTRGVCNDDLFFVGGSENLYYCVDLLTTAPLWSKQINELMIAPVAFAQQSIYLGTLNGSLRRVEADRGGKRFWQIALDGPIQHEFHVDERGIFVATDRRIYGLNTLTGVKLWEPVNVGGVIESPIQVGERSLFQRVEPDGFYAVDIANGRVRWKLPQPLAVLGADGPRLYLLASGRHLMVVNEISGEIEAQLPLGRFDLFARNTTAPAIYTATRAGQVYCIRSKDAPRLTPEMLRAGQ